MTGKKYDQALEEGLNFIVDHMAVPSVMPNLVHRDLLVKFINTFAEEIAKATEEDRLEASIAGLHQETLHN